MIICARGGRIAGRNRRTHERAPPVGLVCEHESSPPPPARRRLGAMAQPESRTPSGVRRNGHTVHERSMRVSSAYRMGPTPASRQSGLLFFQTVVTSWARGGHARHCLVRLVRRGVDVCSHTLPTVPSRTQIHTVMLSTRIAISESSDAWRDGGGGLTARGSAGTTLKYPFG